LSSSFLRCLRIPRCLLPTSRRRGKKNIKMNFTSYSVPKNYKVAKLPKDVVLNYPFASFERTHQRDGDGDRIIANEWMVYKESRTPADQHQKIKDFMDDMTKLTNNMVMIRKKK
jgi:hypothetical protein